MKKRIFIVFIFTLVAIVASLLFVKNNMTNVEKTIIGVLMTGENRIEKLEGLKDGLTDLRYNLEEMQFIVKEASDDATRLHRLATQLVEREPDLIVAFGAIEAQVLKEVMEKKDKFFPVVFIGIGAPAEIGLIEDYRKPNSFFTGINNYHASLSAKRLELFNDLVPGMEKIGVIYSEGIDISEMSLKITEEAAKRLHIHIVPIDISGNDWLETLKEKGSKVDGLLALPSFQVETYASDIIAISDAYGIPSMGLYEHEVEMGFLVSYGSSFYEQGYQGARHVSLILQGNDPGNIPVEVPDEMGFYINEEVRKKLNLTLNENLLKLAKVIGSGDL